MWNLCLSIIKWVILAVLAVFVANFFVENPGTVVVSWLSQDYKFPVWQAVLGVLFLTGNSFLLYFLYRFVIYYPSRSRMRLAMKRRDKGYRAFRAGLVALAVGDADEAERRAASADRLLAETDMTKVLMAQAAQLKGDTRAARRFFLDMLGQDETRFLGLRGLVNQDIHENSHKEALALAREAYRIEPGSKWVLEALFDLEVAAGHFPEARVVVERQRKLAHIERSQANKIEALLLTAQARVELDDSRSSDALSTARKAVKLAPDSLAVSLVKTRAALASDNFSEAVKEIERFWKKQPREALVGLYLEARQVSDETGRKKAVLKLISRNQNASLSLVLRAELAIAEEEWSKAKACLLKAEELAPSKRVYELLSQVEASPGQNPGLVNKYLSLAANARGDGRWFCGSCACVHEEWVLVCQQCQEFGTVDWDEGENRTTLTSLIDPSSPLLSLADLPGSSSCERGETGYKPLPESLKLRLVPEQMPEGKQVGAKQEEEKQVGVGESNTPESRGDGVNKSDSTSVNEGKRAE